MAKTVKPIPAGYSGVTGEVLRARQDQTMSCVKPALRPP
jgi:hypothetical protein